MKIEVKTTIPAPASVINIFDVDVADPAISQDVVMEYVSPADGGPLMRPKTPPR